MADIGMSYAPHPSMWAVVPFLPPVIPHSKRESFRSMQYVAKTCALFPREFFWGKFDSKQSSRTWLCKELHYAASLVRSPVSDAGACF